MEYRRALDQIAEIHAHVARAEVFRGYRAWPTATTSVLAIVAAMAQATVWPAHTPRAYAISWLAVAAAAAAICVHDIAHRFLRESRPGVRARSVVVLTQSMPALFVGSLLTIVMMNRGLEHLLPGIWSVCFSLSIFAARPFLPRAVGWVAMGYLAMGACLLAASRQGVTPPPIWMGSVFGIGQAALAIVLYTNLERNRADG